MASIWGPPSSAMDSLNPASNGKRGVANSYAPLAGAPCSASDDVSSKFGDMDLQDTNRGGSGRSAGTSTHRRQFGAAEVNSFLDFGAQLGSDGAVGEHTRG